LVEIVEEPAHGGVDIGRRARQHGNLGALGGEALRGRSPHPLGAARYDRRGAGQPQVHEVLRAQCGLRGTRKI
jgi:hypothetical protein